MLLKDPLNDRQIKSVKIPPAKSLQSERMYPDPGIKLTFLTKYS